MKPGRTGKRRSATAWALTKRGLAGHAKVFYEDVVAQKPQTYGRTGRFKQEARKPGANPDSLNPECETGQVSGNESQRLSAAQLNRMRMDFNRKERRERKEQWILSLRSLRSLRLKCFLIGNSLHFPGFLASCFKTPMPGFFVIISPKKSRPGASN